MGQLKYNFFSKKGSAGGIVNIQPYAINSFLVGTTNGTPELGVGVIKSATKPGEVVDLPTSTSTANDFEGITTNNRTRELTHITGEMNVIPNSAVGVMRYGTIYARIKTGVSASDITYGAPVYLETKGTEAGYFTPTSANSETSKTVAVKGRFVSSIETIAHGTSATAERIAMIELYNQAQA